MRKRTPISEKDAPTFLQKLEVFVQEEEMNALNPFEDIAYDPVFYEKKSKLPFTKSPAQLSNWLSTSRPNYNMASWCFYGNIETEEGETVAISSIFQQQLNFPKKTPYIAEFSYSDNKTNGYALAPFLVEEFDVNFKIPFSVTADFSPLKDVYLNLCLTSGEMGQMNATYRMSGSVIDIHLTKWEYDLKLTDTMGAIQVGYGASSYLPQWLTPQQRKEISENYNNSVTDYLEATQNPLAGQGSYYYSLPLLTVDSFTLKRNEKSYANANKGTIWVDYVVQSFTKQEFSIVSTATWQFIAIQFPTSENKDDFNGALMVSLVSTRSGDEINTLPMARFYKGDSSKLAENGAINPCYEWNTDQITFTPTKKWVDKSKNSFPVAFTIQLVSPNGTISLTAKAIHNNQAISIANINKYEGVYKVKASIHIKGKNKIDKPSVNGFAWAEVH